MSGASMPRGGFDRAGEPAFGAAVQRRVDALIDMVAPCPWPTHAGLHSLPHPAVESVQAAPARQGPVRHARAPLYTPAERERRDRSPWTTVQAVLAPLQFLVFLISLGLVLRYLATGEGAAIATVSVLVKTGLLYAIMVTGSAWEKAVFGRWLFAPAFFWEDVFSMLVLALHTAYLAAVLLGIGSPREQLLLALAAYATYAVNAGQFLWKLRVARLEAPARAAGLTA